MSDLTLYMVDTGKLVEIKRPVFTTGDCYVVVDKPGEKIYIWLGSKASTDEKGTAAVEARRIDDSDLFNGNAKIISYDEGDEKPEFLALLKNLKVIDKNLAASMLKDVKTGEFAFESDHVNALYRVSSEEYDGMDAIKYKQVPFKKSSLDSEDCFIADLGVDIWVWQGKDSNVKEKVKAMQFASAFDVDRAGAQRPLVFMDGDDDKKFLDIFKGILPKSESKVKDLKLENMKPEKAKKVKKEKKGGICAFFIVVMLGITILL